MVNLFLLLVLSSSLAVPRKAGEIRSPIGISVATGAALEVTTTTVKPSSTTTKILTISTKGVYYFYERIYYYCERVYYYCGGAYYHHGMGYYRGIVSTEANNHAEGVWAPVAIDCSDSSWEPTVDGWMAEDVDQKLKGWWESIPDRANKNFVSEFGGAFGDFEHNLACGVDTEDQCVNPSCKVFLDANAPKWTYFVRVAISNLNRNMRLIHDGIGDGQMDFEALREDVAQSFLPWKDSR
ncbi:hypothetical protein B9Z19DRAFT_1106194, partial [Tuber borchii]